MRLKTILAISGRPGLYKVVHQGKNVLIVETLVDKQRYTINGKDNLISLNEITIFMEDKEIRLPVAFAQIKEKLNGEKVTFNFSAAKPDELRDYLSEILPNYDRARLYPSDIRKMFIWYNILIDSGVTDFITDDRQ
jgi:hypothetical protein